ncbi:MAG TPA: aminotransferase class V-fold PLP-dependent enzyme [Stellaceae bacterium]|nr:aminotransferase class V-fold PLP-dependent enzyme [Stellaceae bacterium]
MSADAGARPLYGAAARAEWGLAPELANLNHGSFGSTPLAVMAAQDAWRRRIEANPTQFMSRESRPALRDAARRVAAELGAEGDDIVFSENATSAANAVLRSLDFKPGDEILITSLGYPAIRNAALYVADRSGAGVVEVGIPLPVRDADSILAAVQANLSGRTRLAIFDHICSGSALVLPVERLTGLAHRAGAAVLIDGAHVPGQLPLDLAELGVEYYVANLHKWLMAPRGTGILWARRDLQAGLHPLTISHGYRKGFIEEFDWTGTKELTGWLSAPAGIDFFHRLGGERLMARNRELALAMGRMLSKAWDTPLAGPLQMFAAMAVVALPNAGPATFERSTELRLYLAEQHGIEAAVNASDGRLWVRIMAQAYNEPADYERLRRAFERIA